MQENILSPKHLLGKIVRLPLKIIPSQAQLPILSGKNRGKKWIVGSGIHGCWLGIYEAKKQNFFVNYVTTGSVVFDLGANVGFYTLLASELVGPDGKVIAFEPVPSNLEFLKKHILINDIHNVTVIESAVSDVNGFSSFDLGPHTSMGKLSSAGTLSVKTSTLDSLIDTNEIPDPDLLKIDIEGAEYKALHGAINLLKSKHPIIFLATHGKDVHTDCCNFLLQYNYQLIPIDGNPLETSREIIAI